MAYRSIESIFEESVISALDKNGINVGPLGSEDYKSTQRHIFIRDAVYYEVLDEYSYNPSFAAGVSYHYDPVTDTTTYNQDFVNQIIRDYVKNRIIVETGRLEIDAQRDLLSRTLKGENILEDIREVLSPGSKKFSKLTGAKIGKGSEVAYRGALLNYIYQGTDKSFESAVETTAKIRGKDDRPAESPAAPAPATPLIRSGQSVRDVALDILESKPKAATTYSPYMEEALQIKKDYDSDPVIKAQKKRIQELNKQRLTRDPASINLEIEDALNQIHQTTYGTPRVPGVAPVVAPGSFADRMMLASQKQQARLVDTLAPGRRPVGAITPLTEYVLYGGGYGSVTHDVWEVNPDARLKIIEFTAKRDRVQDIPFLRDYYSRQIASYERKVEAVTGGVRRSREAIGYKFSPTGELEVEDRLLNRYDRAVKNFSKGLYKLDIPTELNKFRAEVFQINKEHVNELLISYREIIAAGGTLTPEQTALMSNAESLAIKFETHGQALSILEGMRFTTRQDMLGFGRLKKAFLDNIDEFENDPARKAQIIQAIKTNNYLALRMLITSGAGGTATDKKSESLQDEFQKLAEEAAKLGHTDLLRWVNKVSIDMALVKSFVMRRHAENAVYAAQLMANPKYLKSEIKVYFQREVIRRIGNSTKNFLDSYVGANPAYQEIVDTFYDVVGDPDFLKDKKKFLKEKLKGIVKEKIKKLVTKTEFYKKYAVQNILGIEVQFDFVELAFDPKNYIKNVAKNYAWAYINRELNNVLRRYFERSFARYLALKRLLWRTLNRLKKRALVTAANVSIRYLGAIGARIGQALLTAAGVVTGVAVPGLGWIVTAVLMILPIVLRPFIGDKDLGQAFKDFLKFLLVGPCMFVLMIYFVIILPIITLFANFWDNLWSAITGEGDKNPYFNDDNYNLAMSEDRVFGGLGGSAGRFLFGSIDLGKDMISGLVNTLSNQCVDPLNRPRMNASAMVGWNNLKANDFNGLSGSANINCRIMCTAQRNMATLYPGIPSDSGTNLLNCSSTISGQQRFNKGLNYGDPLQRYWCTYTVTDAYAEDFPDISNSDNSSVRILDGWFKKKISQGAPLERIDPGQLSRSCFNKNSLMSGAAIIMSGTDDCSLSGDNHAAMFLKFEGNRFAYINSNSGYLKEYAEVTTENCSGPDMVRMKPKVYNLLSGGKLILNFCSFYQIDATKFDTTGKVCPTDCVPDKNNY